VDSFASAFDDVFAAAPASTADSVAATHAIVREAAANRRPPASVVVVGVKDPAPVDPRTEAFEDALAKSDCVGADDMFTAPSAPRFPLLTRLYRRFRSAMPAPRPVRVDTESSYALYRAGRHGYAGAVAELAQALADHAADGHGGADPDRLRALASDLSALRDEMMGAEVPLSLPPYARGKVHCWEDEGGVCCSLRLRGPDGKVRFATTCTPLEPHTQDVLGYVSEAGIEPGDVLGALPLLARMLGGGSLVPQLAKAAPQIIALPGVKVQDGPVFGKLVAPGSAPLAATMALMQAAQRGDRDARDEATDLAATGDGAVDHLISDAARRLNAGRSLKSRGVTILGWSPEDFAIEDARPGRRTRRRTH